MKKITTIIFTLFLLAFDSIGQSNPKVSNSSTIVWAGLDFSKVKMIGSEGFTDPDAIKEEYFDKWNQLIETEAKKYDFSKAYKKDNRINDLSIVINQNTLPDATKLVINEPYEIRNGEIKNIIKI